MDPFNPLATATAVVQDPRRGMSRDMSGDMVSGRNGNGGGSCGCSGKSKRVKVAIGLALLGTAVYLWRR